MSGTPLLGQLGRTVRFLVRLPALLVVGLLRVWQFVVSPTYGTTCRFYPSCSSYALQAVTEHGLVRGGWLALRRLGRCHPWNPGGVDHVPVSTRKAAQGQDVTAARTDEPHGADPGHRAA